MLLTFFICTSHARFRSNTNYSEYSRERISTQNSEYLSSERDSGETDAATMTMKERIAGWCTTRRAWIVAIAVVATLSLIIGLSVGLHNTSSSSSSSSSSQAMGNSTTPGSDDGRLPPDAFSHPSSSPSALAPSSLSPTFVSHNPSSFPTSKPTALAPRTSFYIIGCVPYEDQDRGTLTTQISSLHASDADFLIHLGDIKNGSAPCTQEAIDEIDEILKLSPVPVFVVVGDNEFNDCSNISPDDALVLWRKTFVGYNLKYWSHKFSNMTVSPDRPEIFSFVNRKTLFLGLNIVGGLVQDQNEWADRHAYQVDWVKTQMLQYQNDIHSVVLFGQADTGSDTSDFFNPIIVFFRDEFPNDIPILYMCADAHSWSYTPDMFGIGNWLRVRITGGVSEPVVRVTVDPETAGTDPVDAFQVERFLNTSR